MNKGFSLVELIVVIAIMAILVGVAVPVYTSYISSANEKVDAQYADELQRAVDTLVIDIEAGLTEEYKDITDIPAELVWSTEKTGDVYVTATAVQGKDFTAFMAALDDLIDLKVAPKNGQSKTITVKTIG